MDEQLDFIEPTKAPASAGSLFLALFPDRSTVQSISELAIGIRSQHGLTGRLRPLDHLHITLHWLGDYPVVPDSLVQNVGQACKSVADRMPSFEVKLDRVVSFRGRPGNHPLVLMGNDDDNSALIRFHQMLLAELAKCWCLGKGNPKFNPHLTLLYDKQHMAEAPVDSVSWSAEEIVLVRSEVVATKYHRLGQWRFGA